MDIACAFETVAMQPVQAFMTIRKGWPAKPQQNPLKSFCTAVPSAAAWIRTEDMYLLWLRTLFLLERCITILLTQQQFQGFKPSLGWGCKLQMA